MSNPGDAPTTDGHETVALASADSTGPQHAPAGASRFEPGTLVAGRFRIVSLLGSGGMGEVYRAEDVRLRQTVALKFLPPAMSADARRVERLTAEVRLGRQVTHPSVCRIHDLGEWAGLRFLSMEYVEGEDLARLLPRIGRLSPDKALELARDVCAGLAAAHAQGVLHRDLKPANVMVDARGRARITDFGLAQPVSDATFGDNAGTPAYMAPEQLDGAGASVQSDLYSLGMVLYEMFTGRRAHRGRTVDEIRREKARPPEAPSSQVPELDASVEAVILRCLAPRPEDRPRSAREVLSALPGGDPLAAALAAGETPSPQLVADASVGGVMPSWGVFALGALVIGCAAGAVVAREPVSVWHHLVDAKPREVLQDRVEEVERMAGLRSAGFAACRYELDEQRLASVAAREDGHWSRLARERSVLTYWCRRSPRSLLAQHENGWTTPLDPPPLPGGSRVSVDHRGRLVELEWTPPAQDAPAVPPPAWSGWFAAAGVDPATIQPTPPRRVPPAFADTRLAWTARYLGAPEAPLRVEAATLGGRLVAFAVLRDEVPPAPVPLEAPRLTLYVTFVGLLALGAAGAMAWRAVRTGRGDRPGAARLALFLAAATVAQRGLAGAPFVGSGFDVLELLVRAARQALLLASMAWIFYMAVEPMLRRRWPELLVAWTRLLAGRPDSLVGRDVLLGCVVGLVHATTVALVNRLLGELLSEDPGLVSGLAATAGLLRMGAGSVTFALVIIMILALAGFLIRRRLLAGIGVGAVMMVAYLLGLADGRARVAACLIVILLVVTLFRFGLLAFVANQFVFLLTLSLPLSTTLTGWRGTATLVWASTLAAIVAWSLWLSFERRRAA